MISRSRKCVKKSKEIDVLLLFACMPGWLFVCLVGWFVGFDYRGVSRRSPTRGPSESLILALWSKVE